MEHGAHDITAEKPQRSDEVHAVALFRQRTCEVCIHTGIMDASILAPEPPEARLSVIWLIWPLPLHRHLPITRLLHKPSPEITL